jgi:hypothetical protein
MNKYHILPVVILLFTFCSGNHDNKIAEPRLPVIDLTGIEQSEDKGLTISEIADHVNVEYIKLETTPNSMVEVAFDVQMNNRNIFIFNKTGLLMFDRNGKFIRDVGTYGKGPNEHLGILGFSCTDSLIAILSNYTKKLLLYNAQGNFLKALPVNAQAGEPDFLNNDCMAISRRFGCTYDENYYICYTVNANGDTLCMRKIKEVIPGKRDVYVQANLKWTYNDTLYSKETLNDTIYTVTTNHIVPRYAIKMGNFKMPGILLSDMKKKEKTAHQYIDLGNIFENSGNLYISLSYDNKRMIAVYNKKTKETNFYTLKGSSVNEHGIVEGGYFTNDIGGEFQINNLHSLNGNRLITIIYPYELDKMQIDKENLSIKSQQKKEEFQNLSKNITITDNPILVVYSTK